MCEDNFLATRDCYIEPLRHPAAIMVSQIINCEKCFILKVNLQIGVMRSDLWNSQCAEFPQISVFTMTISLNVARNRCLKNLLFRYPIYKYNL